MLLVGYIHFVARPSFFQALASILTGISFPERESNLGEIYFAGTNERVAMHVQQRYSNIGCRSEEHHAGIRYSVFTEEQCVVRHSDDFLSYLESTFGLLRLPDDYHERHSANRSKLN